MEPNPYHYADSRYALYGFCRTLLKQIKEELPPYLRIEIYDKKDKKRYRKRVSKEIHGNLRLSFLFRTFMRAITEAPADLWGVIADEPFLLYMENERDNVIDREKYAMKLFELYPDMYKEAFEAIWCRYNAREEKRRIAKLEEESNEVKQAKTKA